MFTRALVPLDGSEPAHTAIPTALRALGPDGQVVLLQVIPSQRELLEATARARAVARSARSVSELTEQVYQRRRARTEDYLRECARSVEEAGGRVHEVAVQEGDPGPAILQAAEAYGCDLIVMATNGRSGWRRAVLGSVAEHVARNAVRIPVVLVRRPPEA